MSHTLLHSHNTECKVYMGLEHIADSSQEKITYAKKASIYVDKVYVYLLVLVEVKRDAQA